MIGNKVCWGIAGLGNVAHRFARDLIQHTEETMLFAVAAKDQARAETFAAEYGCKSAYDSYQLLAEDPSVDIVYIATIHPLHRDMVELFLTHGKHVFVEKPAFTNTKDWCEMSLLARTKNLLLVEAMKTMTFPAYRALCKFIKDNDVKIDFIEASFGNRHEFDINKQIFNPDLSGGATLDVGVYGLWLYVDLCNLTGCHIRQPRVNLWQDNEDMQVDGYVEFIFDGAIQGKITASITRDLKREAIIRGPELEIVIHDKWWNPRNIDILYQNEHYDMTAEDLGGGFEYEIQHMSNLVLCQKTKSDILPNETSEQVIGIVERSLLELDFSHLLNPKNRILGSN